MSISSEITRLRTAKSNIKAAIENKGVSVPDDITISNYSTYIDNILQGLPDENPVLYVDYDGTIVYSYTADLFNALTEHPSNPDHTLDAISLTSQGWNLTLALAKARLNTYGHVEIGQMYITTDGATKFVIDTTLANGYLTQEFSILLRLSKANGVLIDWGDGTSERFSSTAANAPVTHTYATDGTYTLSLLPDDNCTLTPCCTSGYNSIFGYTYNSPISEMCCFAIKAVYYGKNLARVGQLRIRSCEYITLPKEVTTFNCFSLCYKLKQITIPNNLTKLDASAFLNCYSLKYAVLPESLTEITGLSDFLNCYSLKQIILPSTITAINNNTFANCYSLLSIIIPNTVTTIGLSAFDLCISAKTLTLSNGVTTIGSYAFRNCNKIKQLVIPNTVTSIGVHSFNGCYLLEQLTISNKLTIIDTSTFYNCYSLKSLVLPANCTTIGSSAFYNCYLLTELEIPNKVTTIGNNAFLNCYNLKSLTISGKVTSIGNSVFENCNSLTLLTFNCDTTVTIGNTVFRYGFCLKNLVLPEGVTTIGNSAFEITGIETIELPSTVTSIGTNVLSRTNQKVLLSITIKALSPPTIQATTFNNTNNCPIYVPHGKLSAYQSAWSAVSSRLVELPE